MPEYDDLGAGKGVVQLGGSGVAELVPVRDDDLETVQLDLRHLRQLATQLRAVSVAVHRGDRGQRLQLNQDFPGPHIPTMQDMVDLLEGLEDLSAQQPVRIGNDAEAHRSLLPASPLAPPPLDERDLEAEMI